MSELDLSAPEVQEAIKAQAAKQAESIINQRLEGYVPKDEVEGLVNKKDELLGKLSKYKGLTEEDVERTLLLKAQGEKDELAKWAQEGRIDDIKAAGAKQYMEQAKADRADIERQLEAAQGSLSEFKTAGEAKDNEIEFLYKETFLKDLLGNDETFKKGKEAQFMKVYGDAIEFDRETRTFYALTGDGDRVIDAEGNHVKFGDYLGNIKKSDDLFFSGGSGSGIKTGAGSTALGKKIGQMSFTEKNELRKEIGDAEYQKILSNA